jgi:membrane associated rhomboid family serine protease
MTAPHSESTLAARTRAYWYPRVRGGLLVLAGTCVLGAIAAAFGGAPGFGTAIAGMCGSLLAMCWVWWLESRRSRKDDAAATHTQREGGTT